jgi:hypothetical protein
MSYATIDQFHTARVQGTLFTVVFYDLKVFAAKPRKSAKRFASRIR